MVLSEEQALAKITDHFQMTIMLLGNNEAFNQFPLLAQYKDHPIVKTLKVIADVQCAKKQLSKKAAAADKATEEYLVSPHYLHMTEFSPMQAIETKDLQAIAEAAELKSNTYILIRQGENWHLYLLTIGPREPRFDKILSRMKALQTLFEKIGRGAITSEDESEIKLCINEHHIQRCRLDYKLHRNPTVFQSGPIVAYDEYKPKLTTIQDHALEQLQNILAESSGSPHIVIIKFLVFQFLLTEKGNLADTLREQVSSHEGREISLCLKEEMYRGSLVAKFYYALHLNDNLTHFQQHQSMMMLYFFETLNAGIESSAIPLSSLFVMFCGNMMQEMKFYEADMYLAALQGLRQLNCIQADSIKTRLEKLIAKTSQFISGKVGFTLRGMQEGFFEIVFSHPDVILVGKEKFFPSSPEVKYAFRASTSREEVESKEESKLAIFFDKFPEEEDLQLEAFECAISTILKSHDQKVKAFESVLSDIIKRHDKKETITVKIEGEEDHVTKMVARR